MPLPLIYEEDLLEALNNIRASANETFRKDFDKLMAEVLVEGSIVALMYCPLDDLELVVQARRLSNVPIRT